MTQPKPTSQSDTSASSWGFIHLAEHEGDFGFTIELDDFGLLHFVVQIITFTGSLSDTSENRETTMSLCNIVL